MITRPLRRIVYGILCGGGAYAGDTSISVLEYVRDGDKLNSFKVEPSYLLQGKKLPSL